MGSQGGAWWLELPAGCGVHLMHLGLFSPSEEGGRGHALSQLEESAD